MVRRENRKRKRILLENPLKVTMCSIGAQVKYELKTRNISYGGFFLSYDSPGRFPFTPASIMEVWLELSDDLTVFFNGKMARVVYPGDSMEAETGTGIAIRIVQIDHQTEIALREFIDDMLTSAPGEDVA